MSIRSVARTQNIVSFIMALLKGLSSLSFVCHVEKDAGK